MTAEDKVRMLRKAVDFGKKYGRTDSFGKVIPNIPAKKLLADLTFEEIEVRILAREEMEK